MSSSKHFKAYLHAIAHPKSFTFFLFTEIEDEIPCVYMYINFQKKHSGQLQDHGEKCFVSWEHWSGIMISVVAGEELEFFKSAKEITERFQLLAAKVKITKDEVLFLLCSSPLDKECPVVASMHQCKMECWLPTFASRVWYFAKQEKKKKRPKHFHRRELWPGKKTWCEGSVWTLTSHHKHWSQHCVTDLDLPQFSKCSLKMFCHKGQAFPQLKNLQKLSS